MAADPIRVQTVFLGAVNLTDPEARKAYLEQACGGDGELKGRVEALLRAHDAPDSLLDEPLVAPTGEAEAHSDGEAIDAALSFLGPPQRPGSLGRIGHYEVLEVLGRGGFGVVFRAFDETLQRVVAVKVLAPHIAATSPARKRFLREARTAAQVRHENVVQVHAVVEEPLPYLVMEYVPGETLQQRMDRTGPLGAGEVVSIGRQVAAGLAAAHAKGLIHRDIKPGNILVDGGSGRRVTITDFGLARAADDASLTKSGLLAGTPMFMAPEQAKGETLDARADLFSLGSVLYTMATGRPPFRASGTMAVLKRVCDEDPRPIREVIPEVPEWLCRIIEKLHAKDPGQRFPSASEVEALLADCERQLAEQADVKDLRRIPPKVRRAKSAGRFALRDDRLIPTRPRGLWNPSAWASFLAAIVVIGAGLFVVVRGKLEAQRAIEAEQRMRLQAEQAHGRGDAYRVPIDEKAGWVRLFNGKDFDGWIERDLNGTWHITVDGAMHLNGQGALFTKKDYQDFHLAAEVRVLGDADSGIFFRCDRTKLDGKHPVGFEAMINAVDQRNPRTGSLTDPFSNYHYGTDPQVPAGEWFTYEVIAEGNRLQLKVNGKRTLEMDADAIAAPQPNDPRRHGGAIGLQFPGHGRAVEFRNLWVLPLHSPRQTAAGASNAARAQALREKAAALEKTMSAVDAAVNRGAAPRMELLDAQASWLDAKAAVAEAERNFGERDRCLKSVLNCREEQRKLLTQMRAVGSVSASALNEIETKIADVKVRLAKAEGEGR